MTTKWLLILLLLASSGVARGDVTFQLDLVPGEAGIQDELLARPGDAISVDVVMTTTSPSRVTSYQVSFGFDDSRLRFVDAVETPPVGFSSLADATINPSDSQEIDFIEAFDNNFASTGLIPNQYTIARLNFDTLASLRIGEATELTLFEDILDGTFNADFSQAATTFNGARVIGVAAVPEPTTILFVGWGGVAFVFRRRRNGRRVFRSDNASRDR